jgi:hypothetical protein
MRSVMCISYCLHDWQTIFIILFYNFWTVDREKNSVVIKDRERDAQVRKNVKVYFKEVETSHHLILIRLYFILTILITEDDHNHIVFDWIKIIVYNNV